MAKITFNKLGLKTIPDTTNDSVEINGIEVPVKCYLTQQEKADLIAFVLENAVDNRGCFSPIRVETFWGIALVKWYGGISFTDKQIFDAGKTYDLLETNGVIDDICDAIPNDEYTFLKDMLNDTKDDITRYNNSFAGIIAAAANSAENMDNELTQILTKIKNKEGLEQLSVISDIVG